MMAGIYKGVFVFFLGMFIGGASLKYFRPHGIPTEREILLANKALRERAEKLRAKFQKVADVEIKEFVLSKNSKNEAVAALQALIPILTDDLGVKVEAYSRPPITEEPIEGYEPYRPSDK